MQFIDNLKTSYSNLPTETQKILLLLGSVGGGLILVFIIMVIMSLTPTQRTKTGASATAEVTQTPEQIAAMTLAPPTPTQIPFITKKDLDAVMPQGTPTPTPLPGVFYIANGQQNDLQIRFAYFDEGDTFDEIRVRNNKTLEERPIGYMLRYTPGNSAFFSSDFSQVIYLGGTKADYHKITFYSIPQNRNVKYITLDQMKQALPQLKSDASFVFSSLTASPNKSKVALSYGDTFSTKRITPGTQIIVIRLSDNKIQLLPVKGLVKGWKDETTLEYEVNTTNPAVNNTLEAKISGL